ncbi:MAG: molybdenum ABC transporter ATP-binding protein [Candidatus Sericytochromatia bacterium]|nr:molybdenum ABC transporter ATP-binding protein [Candidatus Sericytochromatia bacterium]
MIQARFQLAYPTFALQVDLDLPAHGVTALFGHSGSGKTSLLRCLAGLEKTASGYLNVNGEIWQDKTTFLPTYQRPLGYVFQEANLFPHLSVRQNLEYGLKRIPAAARQIHFEQVVLWLGLTHCLDRKNPLGLSGGEKQRVAMGRALLSSPRLLLMDEPLSGLDEQSKAEIMPYLEQMHRALDIPVIYVSHSLNEVLQLADQIVVLEQGKAIANGPIQTVLTRLDLPLSQREDASSILEATLAFHDQAYQLSRLDFAGGHLWVSQVSAPLGSVVRACVLARDVSLATARPEGSSINNILSGTITEIQVFGAAQLNVSLLLGDSVSLLSRITRLSGDRLGLKVGMQVFVQIKSVSLIL